MTAGRKPKFAKSGSKSSWESDSSGEVEAKCERERKERKSCQERNRKWEVDNGEEGRSDEWKEEEGGDRQGRRNLGGEAMVEGEERQVQ